jgi:hypothetical protein
MKSFKVHGEVRVDARDIAIDLSEKKLFEFIVELDIQRADWDFTLKLYRYFEKQKAIYEREAKHTGGDL